MLKLCHITHSFDENPLLEDFNLELHPGERLAIMGPSGSGKTTVLRIILGLLSPKEGTIHNSFPKTAMVFQEPRLLPWRTALENVNLVLGDHTATLPQARTYLQMMDLSDAAEKYPAELSGGMQQRVAIARALATNPDLLILDEPFKAMDEALRKQVIDLVGKTNAAILMVTHERSEAEHLHCRIFQLYP